MDESQNPAPEDDAAEPSRDAAEPSPDAAEPSPDAAEPSPDAAEPAEGVAEPAEGVDEQLEDAAPVVGGSADLGEPMTPMGETFQVGVDVPASQEPPETSPAVLQNPTEDEPLPSPIDAIDANGEAPAAEAASDQAEVEEPVVQVEQPVVEVEEPVVQVEEPVVEIDEEPVETSRDPFRGPGDWYVVHTYAGYENKVKTNLESRIHTMQMEDKIFAVHIPMEDVMEIKGGKKQVVQRKVFPGYLLVKMVYDNDSWYVVRNTPGVTGFVAAGTGSKPTPLSRREVEKILAVKKEEVKPQFRLGFEENDVVRIISGPFADFNGTISEINLDQSKLKVLVNIFDRETPVELSFDQVAKV
jgi:transcriptional antiterminator NusG